MEGILLLIFDKSSAILYFVIMIRMNHQMNKYCSNPQPWALFAVTTGNGDLLTLSRGFCMNP